MTLPELANTVNSLTVSGDIDGVIKLLKESTKPEGPLHPDNESELNLWNLPGWQFFLRQGKYKEAECIYRAFYQTLLEQQKSVGRVHKGMPLHNLGLSLYYQGQSKEAIKYFFCAYVEDVIRANGADTVEQGLASKIIRGFVGVPESDLLRIRDLIMKRVRRSQTIQKIF